MRQLVGIVRVVVVALRAINGTSASLAGTTDNKLHCNEAQSDSLLQCTFARAQLHIQSYIFTCVFTMYSRVRRRVSSCIQTDKRGADHADRSGIQNVQGCIVDCGQRSEMNRSSSARQAHRLAVTYCAVDRNSPPCCLPISSFGAALRFTPFFILFYSFTFYHLFPLSLGMQQGLYFKVREC